MKIPGHEIDVFGDTDPLKMPKHLYFGALDITYASAERADTDKQVVGYRLRGESGY